MELWFSEFHSTDFKVDFRIRKQLFGQYSDYQHIQVFDTYEFGRMLVMDNVVMLTEKRRVRLPRDDRACSDGGSS